jgi:hypothetical protein
VVVPTVAPFASNTVIVAPAKGAPVAAVPDKLVLEEEVELEELPPPPQEIKAKLNISRIVALKQLPIE